VPQLPPWSFEPKGRYDEHLFESELLKGNPLHDPPQRPLWVYLPPGYDAEPERRYPSIYVIQGLTGQIDMWRNRNPFRRNFPELADAPFAAGGAPAVHPYICRLLDLDRREPVSRLTRHRQVPQLPLQ
jgi:hypothetical protein